VAYKVTSHLYSRRVKFDCKIFVNKQVCETNTLNSKDFFKLVASHVLLKVAQRIFPGAILSFLGYSMNVDLFSFKYKGFFNMLFWIVLLAAIAPVVALNIVATKTIKQSNIHSELNKRRLYITVWALPVFGVLLAMLRINKDLKKMESQSEDKLTDALKQFTDSITTIEANLQRKQKNPPLH